MTYQRCIKCIHYVQKTRQCSKTNEKISVLEAKTMACGYFIEIPKRR